MKRLIELSAALVFTRPFFYLCEYIISQDMNRFSHFTATALAVFGLFSTGLYAQSTLDLLKENPERLASVHHSYEYIPQTETAAPKGFKPFYVSHYGRHGSRRMIGSTATLSYDYMRKADSLGILTPLGRELFADVIRIHEDHIDMDGELSSRGGREHREIAGRLYNRAKPVFTNKKRDFVDVQSSIVPRCLISMANFTAELDDRSPRLHFSYITGTKYINLLSNNCKDSKDVRRYARHVQDSILTAEINPDRFIKAIFTVSTDSLTNAIAAPRKIMEQIFYYGGAAQCLEIPVDIIGKYFTFEEAVTEYKAHNARSYINMGNSARYGDNMVWAARDLVRDFVSRADDAISKDSDKAADLRFGHDTGIMPLVGLMDIVGPGDRMDETSTAFDKWQSFRYLSMASNLQLIFYRNSKNEILVRTLYNEKEAAFRGLQSYSGPYYRWQDLRAHLLTRAEKYDNL